MAAAGDDTGDPFPLTEAQKEIWLAAQMGGAAAVAYNESLSLDFRGDFDTGIFRRSLSSVVERHPIVLAAISPDGLTQHVPPGAKLDVSIIGIDKHSPAERESSLQEIISREISDAFDLTAGPLARVRIVKLSQDHHIVIWTAHHIVCDGWSGGLIVYELAKIYSGLAKGNKPQLDSPIPFRQYVTDTFRDEKSSQEAISYWQAQLSELPSPLELPLDHPRPAVRSAQASTVKRPIDSNLHQSLKRLAGQQRTTVVVTLMAVLNTLLHRLTGQSDIVVGLGVAGQAVTGKSCLVGHCVNLLPIRARLEPEKSFLENLQQIKKSVLDAYDHHQSTIGEILKNIKIPRSAGRPPLIEVIFNVDRDPGCNSFEGANFRCDRNAKRALHFDLFFNFVEAPDGLYVECDYNTDLFETATIDRWLGHFEALLASATTDPDVAISRLPILSNAEYWELTDKVIDPSFEFPKDRTLQGWFESQVEKTPNARAVTFEDKHLTYWELNSRANQIAHHLTNLGVGPNSLVGLFVERSFEMVIGILGILKAGAAYLPIDPVYPKGRITFLLEDADAPILLMTAQLASQFPELKTKIVYFDLNAPEIAKEPTHNPPQASSPDDLAYVIYTSGSTGKPKGTLITNFNVVRLLQATEHWYGFDKRDVGPSSTPTRLTSAFGSCGERFCTAGVWW